jgi:DNA-directed RNA polymerase specialized sigma24 family protein
MEQNAHSPGYYGAPSQRLPRQLGGPNMTSAKTTNAVSKQPQLFRNELISLIPYSRAFSRSLCGDRELADDLAQYALAKAWSAQTRFSWAKDECGANP